MPTAYLPEQLPWFSKYWSTHSSNLAGLKGFSIKRVLCILLIQFSSSGDMRAVMMMVKKGLSVLRPSVISQRVFPSIFGILMSEITTSGSWVVMMLRPSSPLAAVKIWYPCFFNLSSITRLIWGSSSITRIFLFVTNIIFLLRYPDGKMTAFSGLALNPDFTIVEANDF